MKETDMKQGKKPTSKKRKENSIYGNYRFYYGYRIDHTSEEDPRLSAFKKEWFEGKDCLDIGCNQGLLTIAIAKKFSCRSILGVDIDNGLIDTAYWNLRKVLRTETSCTRSLEVKASFKSGGSGAKDKIYKLSVDEKEVTTSDSPKKTDLSERVSFAKENFVESLSGCSEKYDTVLCLSVTKWVHLNWGDEGIITLFVKIWRLLRPDGILLLEPQPWKSYEKNKRVSDTARYNFKNILFAPNRFEEILLDKVGFRSVENVTDSLNGTVAGFDRPIFAFRK